MFDRSERSALEARRVASLLARDQVLEGRSFSNSDPAAAEDEARREAVANALAKAETLAEAAGVSLGRVVSISEQSAMPQPMMMRADMMMAKAEGGPPIAAGENTYNITVNMTLAIDQ